MRFAKTVETLVRDVRFPLRVLGLAPLFTLVAVTTLASHLPARRVAAVEPAEALAAE